MHPALPITAGDWQGRPERFFAPQRKLARTGAVLRRLLLAIASPAPYGTVIFCSHPVRYRLSASSCAAKVHGRSPDRLRFER
jgi:hypothetical protein